MSLDAQGQQHDVQIDTHTLRAESKIFFLDLKENLRGKYIKISERGINRERSTIVVPPAGVEWFMALLTYFIEGRPAEEGQPASKQLQVESKAFFFEAGENPRGRYLRISESGPGTRGNSSLIVPSGGANCSAWVNLRDQLARMHTTYLSDPTASPAAGQVPPELDEPRLSYYQEAQRVSSPTKLDVAGPQQLVGPGPSAPTLGRTKDGIQVLRVGHKRFFFDLGTNLKGEFLKITETVGTDRMSIIVPGAALELFNAAVLECIEQQRANAGQ